MTTPTTETKKALQYITVIVDCHVNDEYAEAPSFIGIRFDMEELLALGQYRRGLEDMQARGLDPFKVSTFSHNAIFLDPIDENPLNPEQQKSLRFLSESDKAEWESRFNSFDEAYVSIEDGDDEVEYSDLDFLEGDHHIETDMMNITANSMSILGYIKHTNIRVESNFLYEADLDKIEAWVKEL